MSRLSVFWAALWRVSLLAIGLVFAVSAVWADQLNMAGCKQADIVKIEDAARLFPFDWFLRTKPGYFYVETGDMSFRSEAEIRKVLLTDPYSVDLLTALYTREVLLGDHADAARTAQLVHTIAPRASLIKQIEGSMP